MNSIHDPNNVTEWYWRKRIKGEKSICTIDGFTGMFGKKVRYFPLDSVLVVPHPINRIYDKTKKTLFYVKNVNSWFIEMDRKQPRKRSGVWFLFLRRRIHIGRQSIVRPRKRQKTNHYRSFVVVWHVANFTVQQFGLTFENFTWWFVSMDINLKQNKNLNRHFE